MAVGGLGFFLLSVCAGGTFLCHLALSSSVGIGCLVFLLSIHIFLQPSIALSSIIIGVL